MTAAPDDPKPKPAPFDARTASKDEVDAELSRIIGESRRAHHAKSNAQFVDKLAKQYSTGGC